jgi:hypothetical protein
VDRLKALLIAEWRAYFRRLFRGGTSAKSNLVLLALIAIGVSGRYIKFLRESTLLQVELLAVAVFFTLATTLRNDGPLTYEALQRFPLTPLERTALRIFSALVPPLSWLVVLFCCGIFLPLFKLGVIPTTGGVALMTAGIAASQIPIPMPRFQPRSRSMTLLRKEIRYILGLPEHALILLLTLAFCIYLVGGEGLQADALRAVLGILALLSVSFPMNAFGLDAGSGLDRYRLSPLASSRVIETKNAAFVMVAAVQRLPILLLSVWRFGATEASWALVEAASLTLLVLAWGNVTSVRSPNPPDSQPAVIDGLVGAAAALLPCAAAIGILRGGSNVATNMSGMLALCGVLYFASLHFAGAYFTKHFDRIRALLVG